MIAQGLHSLDQHHWPTPHWQPTTITEGIEKGTLPWVDFVPGLQEIQNLETQDMRSSQSWVAQKRAFDAPTTQFVHFGPKRGHSPACAGTTLILHDMDAAIAASGGGHTDLGVTVV